MSGSPLIDSVTHRFHDWLGTGGAAHVTGNSAQRIVANYSNPASGGAYTAGDNIGNSATAGSVIPITFTIGRNSGRITGCRCVVTPASGNLVTTALDFELLLFRPETSIPYAVGGYPADNAAHVLTAAAYREKVAAFRFSSSAWRSTDGTTTAATTTAYQSVALNSTRILAAFNTSGLTQTLVGVIQVLGAWTPGAVVNRFDFALDTDLD